LSIMEINTISIYLLDKFQLWLGTLKPSAAFSDLRAKILSPK
jgi:hypothetical protein